MIKLKIKIKEVALISLLFTVLLLADSSDVQMGFDYFIERVENGVLEMELHQLNIDKAENEIENVSSVYDPRFYSSIQGYGVNNYDDFSNNDLYTIGSRASAGISKKLTTGTEISTELSLDFYQNRGDIESMQMNEDTYEVQRLKQSLRNKTFSPELKLTVSHPLLMNRGGVADKFIINSATLRSDVAQLSVDIEKNVIIDSYRNEYVQLLQQQSDIDLMDQIHTDVKSLENRAARMVREGLFTRGEYAQFTIFTLQLEERIVQYEGDIDSKQQKLSAFLPDTIQHRDELEMLYSMMSAESLDSISFDSTKQGMIFQILEQEASEHISLRKNLLAPELNLFGEATAKHYTNNRFKPERNDRNDFGVNFTVGAQFSMPIGNRKARSELTEAELAYETVVNEKSINQRDYLQRYADLKRYFSLYQELIIRKQTIISTLHQKASEDRRLFRQARIDLSDLQETQTAIVEENIALNNYKANLINIVLDYFSLIN